jgi:hypothetical protein
MAQKKNRSALDAFATDNIAHPAQSGHLSLMI